MTDYQDFLSKLQKNGSHTHHIKHCFGTRDAWKWVRKNHWKALNGKTCTASLYSQVINTVNLYLTEQLIEGHQIILPYQFGSFNLSSVETKISIDKGKVKNNYRVDWKKTLDYWYKDKEAKEAHNYIKRVQKYLYFIKYDKRGAVYKNRRFYAFRANRSLVRRLGRRIEEGRVNAERL